MIQSLGLVRDITILKATLNGTVNRLTIVSSVLKNAQRGVTQTTALIYAPWYSGEAWPAFGRAA